MADVCEGDVWLAKVSGKLKPVRVVAMFTRETRRGHYQRMLRLKNEETGKMLPKARAAQFLRELVSREPPTLREVLIGKGYSLHKEKGPPVRMSVRDWRGDPIAIEPETIPVDPERTDLERAPAHVVWSWLRATGQVEPEAEAQAELLVERCPRCGIEGESPWVIPAPDGAYCGACHRA